MHQLLTFPPMKSVRSQPSRQCRNVTTTVKQLTAKVQSFLYLSYTGLRYVANYDVTCLERSKVIKESVITMNFYARYNYAVLKGQALHIKEWANSRS
jgi:hypothetical protein